MAGWLVDAYPFGSLFFYQQESPVLLNYRGDGGIGFPDHEFVYGKKCAILLQPSTLRNQHREQAAQAMCNKFHRHRCQNQAHQAGYDVDADGTQAVGDTCGQTQGQPD